MPLSTHRALTFAQAAKRYGLPENMLRDATNRKFNRLPSIGRGAHKRLIPHLLEKWIDVQATRN